MIDGGNPFGPPQSIGGRPSEAASGYSVIDASDHDLGGRLLGGRLLGGRLAAVR